MGRFAPWRWCAAVVVGLGVAFVSAAAPPPPGVTEVTTVEGITEYRLANGLQVLLVPDDSKPTTTVNVTYHVGSRMENYGETGMAHLLEHLMFKGTPTTRNLLGEFTKRGMRANGSTSFDRTNYFASFAANDENLRWLLSWQADAMVHSLIARSDLDSEMTVVRNEMESGENSPQRVLLQRVWAAMFQWHNYGKDTIGARSDVENVDISRLQAFYRRYYQPDNATLIVAGRFDPQKVLGWVAQYFVPIPRPTRVLRPTYTLDPAQDGERSVTVRRAGGSPVIYIAYHAPAGPDPRFAAAEIAAWALGNPPASRLHKRLVEKGLAASTFGTAFDNAEPGSLLFGIRLAPGQDVQRAEDAALAVVEGTGAEPLTADEVNRSRTQWLNDWEQTYADPEAIGISLSEAIGRGDWRLFFLKRDQVRALTVADVQRAATEFIRRDNRTVGLYLPTARPERAPAPERADVAALLKDYHGDSAAAQVEAFDATPANLDARTRRSGLASGLKVALLPKGTRGQTVQARLRLHYGDVRSLQGLETVAAMAGLLIDKGGAGLTRQQISDRFDQLQSDVDFGASGQSLTVTITSRRAELPEVIALVGSLLRDPAFGAEALDEMKRRWLAGIERQRHEPGAVAANAVQRHGNPYPRGDLRYVPTFDEMVQDVNAVTPQQLRDFQRRFYSAASAEFAAVGDFDATAVGAALEKAFGDWSQPADGALPYRRVPEPLVAVAPARFVLPTPDKQNANLQAELALPLQDTSPDYPALLLANRLFGSSGASRLWNRIREKEGLSYDVGSGVAWNAEEPNSRWVATAIFAPQNQPRVEAALKDELARALKDGFTEAEFEQARTGLLNERRLLRAQDAVVAGQLVQNLHLGRSFALSQQVDDALSKLTLEQVNAAFRRYIDPAKLVVAWAGDFAGKK